MVLPGCKQPFLTQESTLASASSELHDAPCLGLPTKPHRTSASFKSVIRCETCPRPVQPLNTNGGDSQKNNIYLDISLKGMASSRALTALNRARHSARLPRWRL